MKLLAAAFALLAAAPAFAEDGAIVTARGTTVTARDIRLKADGGALVIEYTDSAGARKTLKADEVVEIAFGAGRPVPAPRPTPEDVEITLTTGDVLMGKAGARAAEGIQLQSKVYGSTTVKFENVRSLLVPVNRASLPKTPPARVDTDVVFKKNGDRGEGTILGISNASVDYKSTGFNKDLSVPLADVAGIWMVSIGDPPKEPGNLFAIVHTADGSALRGQMQSLEEGVLTFKDLYGQVRKVAANEVSGLFMKNGRVVYLSDVDPAKVEEDANYIRGVQRSPSDLDYPFQRDRSARGTRLVLGGVEHRKGLGVRAHSQLTYALGGGYQRFQATVGLDAASMGLGAVLAEIQVDGKKAWEATFKGNDGPQTVDVDVAGAKELRLVMTWAGNGQSDFADWASARLIR